MNAPHSPPSIYDLEPIDSGGIEARDGFALQDHVAVGFCLEMLSDAALGEVWCESQDDITLIWQKNGGVLVEFVQVKGSAFDQLWSVAKLTEREKAKSGVPGRCIMEKSLAQDRCREECCFRLVTARDVNGDLGVLCLPRDAPGRRCPRGIAAIDALGYQLCARTEGYRSLNGRDAAFWATSAYWEVRHSEQSVEDANLIGLHVALHALGVILAPDQLRELYAKLLKLVWDAARAKPHLKPEEKRIRREAFEAWLRNAAAGIGQPSAPGGDKVREKMAAAGLAEDVIRLAQELRIDYRTEQLSQKYLQLDEQRLTDGEIRATLQRLKSQLDDSKLPDDGVSFHEVCLEELDNLRVSLPINPLPQRAYMQGCMYSITARCLHRFRRVTS